MPQAPSKPAPPPKPPGSPPPAANATPSRSFGINRGVSSAAHKIVIYGPGGVGKSELASLIAKTGCDPLFIDIEQGTHFLDVARVDPCPETFEEVRESVRMAAASDDVGAIVIDSFTKLEELATSFTLRHVKHEKGHLVSSIEAYGFGKGYTHVYESFLLILQDLDAAARAGKHVVAICHDCTANVPNPSGEDWIRYEPRLQSPPSGKGSIRHRVKEWCDHLLYVGFDTIVDEGKGQGVGTRTIYPVEMPTHWAKSRRLTEPYPYDKGDASIWQAMLGR